MKHARGRLAAVAVIAVASVGVSACGSSSKTNANTPAPASTPASPSTPSTTTQPAALPASTPLSSSQGKAYLVSIAVTTYHTTEAQATKFVACFVPKLQAVGINTLGEYKSSPDSKTAPLNDQCRAQAGFK